ncbi:MAG: DNA mismatch repair endonuclease MutL [Pseudanabaenaceae cyanobacterium]
MINTLPPAVVRLIAAGEVIDSLASAVRELAENAIDAGANRIVINIWTDSFTIQVTDNGKGISYSDLLQVALPHTTSKIANQEDLTNITTLGFRGEALHCLAQLGKLTIISRQGSAPAYQVDYNQQGECINLPRETAFAEGTTVKVTNLFAHYPQRLSMLPSMPQQIRQIQKQVYNLAIANPHVSWQIYLENKEWLKLWAGDIITQILPNLNSTDLVSLDYRDLQVILGLPDRYHRPRPDWVKVIINRRVVHYPELEQTILNSFQRKLPRNRYPLCLVHIKASPSQMDWNRHPAKLEVYLDQLQYWQTYITDTICRLLERPIQPKTTRQLFQVAENSISYSTAPQLCAIAQVLKTYILAENSQGIYLIEQHTAHERVLYEHLEDQWQIVPIPEPILLHGLTETQVFNLTKMAVDISEFGSNTWVVRSLPKLLVDHPEAVAILTELSQQEEMSGVMAQLACRSAIKNGTELDLATMQTIIQQWQATRNPHTCPHGRPICLHLKSNDLARIFRRNWLIGNS